MPGTITKIEKTPSIPKLKRVAAYARVSTEKDAMLHSLYQQVSYYSELIQSHIGWEYAGVYADEAKTGTKDSRDGFQRLLSDCRAGKVQMVITKSISRFARNTVTLLEAVRELKSLGIDVYFEEQNIHTLSADGELMLTILASYAQEESRSVSENQKWRVRKGFENGELVNLRFLFGYNISKGSITVNPEQAEIVREVFRRAIAGDSLSSIAGNLNERNVDCVLGGNWTPMSIRQMLSNEKYTGNALLMKRYRNNHIEKKFVKNNGELPMYYAEDTHDAIISMETFEQAQAVLKRLEDQTKDRPKPKQSAFTSMIRCEKCGQNYRRRVSHGIAFWECSSYTKYGKTVCPGCRIHENMLYELTASVAPINEIEKMSAADNTLTFHLKNGSVEKREWQLRSRAESWTPEMKETARQAAIKQRRGHKCRE